MFKYTLKKICILATVFFLLLLLSVFSFASCAETELYSEGEGEIEVVCTTFVPFELARIVGGDNVTVTILQDSGADLHNYSPTTATLSALSKADVFIYIGGESDEKWVPDAIEACKNENMETVCLMDSVEEPLHTELENDWSSHSHTHDEDEHEGHEHHADEHIWTSLKNASAMTEAVCSALCKTAPDSTSDFEARASKYISEIELLDSQYEDAVSSARLKNVIVADRFPFVYLFHDYKISYAAAFSGCSTEVNASFEMQISLIEAVKSSGAGAVLTIEGIDKALAEAISNETGCKILSLNSLQSVKRSDIKNGITYLGVMSSNLNVIKEVLS